MSSSAKSSKGGKTGKKPAAPETKVKSEPSGASVAGGADSGHSGKRKRTHTAGSAVGGEPDSKKPTAGAAAKTAPTQAAAAAPTKAKNNTDWSKFVKGWASKTMAAPNCRDNSIPGCLVVTVAVLSSYRTGGNPAAGGAKYEQIKGTGLILRIDVPDDTCGDVLLRDEVTDEIIAAEVTLTVEEGLPRDKSYIPAKDKDEYNHFLEAFPPCKLVVGAAMDWSVFVTKDFYENPGVGTELRLNVRHTVVASASAPPRDFLNTPGAPKIGGQRGVFELYDFIKGILENQDQPRACFPRYDGEAESVAFPIFVSVEPPDTKIEDKNPRVTYLVNGDVMMLDSAELTYTAPTEDELNLGRGERRPVFLSTRIIKGSPVGGDVIGIDQGVSIFPSSLDAAIPGMSRERVIALLTQPSTVYLLDMPVWYKGNHKRVPVFGEVDEQSARHAKEMGLKMSMGFPQPSAAASFIIPHLGRFLRSESPKFADKIGIKSPLVVQALQTKLDPEIAKLSLIPALVKDLRTHRPGTAAVLCAEVASCLCEDTPADAPNGLHNNPNIHFYMLPGDNNPLERDTLDLLGEHNRESPGYARQVKGAIKIFDIIVYISDVETPMAEDTKTPAAADEPAAPVGTPVAQPMVDDDDGAPFTQASAPAATEDEEPPATAPAFPDDFTADDIPAGM